MTRTLVTTHRDYKYNDFPGYELPEWPEKRALAAEIRTAVEPAGTKVIGLTTGMFLGWLFAPNCKPRPS